MNYNYLIILIKKEILQIKSDLSILAITFLLPLLLVFIYGNTLRMDIKPVSLAVVNNSQSEIAQTITDAFVGSNYFKTIKVPTLKSANKLMEDHKIRAYVYLENNFASEFSRGRGSLLVIVNGTEAQAATLASGYIQSTILLALQNKYPQLLKNSITINSRSWFNEANDSTWFLFSGQYIGIITVMCVFLSSFVISREWDRGTIETLSASNAQAFDIVLSKVIVYFALGFIGMLVTFIVGQWFFQIPIRGNIFLLFLNMAIYTAEMIILGVLISALCKSQFLSVEYAIIAGFLPAVMLSGLIFDLRAVSDFIMILGNLLPPTYAIQSNRILFLSGGSTDLVFRNYLIHLAFIVFLFVLAVLKVRRDIKC